MLLITTRLIITVFMFFCLSGWAFAQADFPLQASDLPHPQCDQIQVPEGNQFAFRAYAQGVQRYRWNGTAWTFVEPVATLYSDRNYHAKIGIHYAGPTWESNGGDKIVGARVDACTPDLTAIPWLLLRTTSTEGMGMLNGVLFIQRLNTQGGLTPTAPGTQTGAIADVPYTAEYYFYRGKI